MPHWVCADCGYEAKDKYTMERHHNRKYPCNSVGIATKGTMEVKKINEVSEDELQPRDKDKVNYKMKDKKLEKI